MKVSTIDPAVRARVGVGKKDKLPSFAWPGGYPIFYIDRDGTAICPRCANHKRWYDKRIIGADINYEDDSLYCENCNKRIESAYAEE